MASESLYTVLMAQLKKSGIEKKYAMENLFPYWWDDRLKENDGSVMMVIMYLSDLMGVELDKFWNEETNPKDELIGEAKFKKTVNKTEEDVELAAALAIKIGIWAAKACKMEYVPLPNDPLVIREAIMANAKTVTLEGLLDYLWDHGIPVIYMADFPTEKPDALCSFVGGRPFIVLTSDDDDPAKQQICLAHEAGHIALNHLENKGSILDINISSFGRAIKKWYSKVLESDANQFAGQVNMGSEALEKLNAINADSDEDFQNSVRGLASTYRVEPAVIAHTSIFESDYHDLANKYFKTDGAINLIRNKMLQYLDEDRIDSEIWAGLLKMTGTYELYYPSAGRVNSNAFSILSRV